VALQKQTITLELGFGGLDQQSDEKYAKPLRFQSITDARFNKVGRVDRRYGHEALGTGYFTGAGAALKIFPTDNGIAEVIDGNGLLAPLAVRVTDSGQRQGNISHSTYSSGYISSNGSMAVSELTADAIGLRWPFGAPNGSVTIDGGWCRADSDDFYVVGYNYSGINAVLTPLQFALEVRDKETGAFLRELGMGAHTRARIISHPDGRNHYFVAASSAITPTIVNLFGFSATTGSFFFQSSVSVTGVTSQEFDVWACADANNSASALVFIAWAKGASGMEIRAYPFPNGAAEAYTPISTTTITGNVSRVALCEHHNRSDTTAVVRPIWFDSTAGAGVKTATYSHTLSQILAPVSITSTTSIVPEYLAGITLATQTGSGGAGRRTIAMLDYNPTANSWERYINSYLINDSNTPSLNTDAYTSNTPWKGMSLHSRLAAAPSSDVAYCWMSCDHRPTEDQRTLFLAESTDGSFAGSFHKTHVTVGSLFHTYAFGAYSRTVSHLPNLQWDGTQFVGSTVAVRRNERIGYLQNVYSLFASKFRVDAGVGWLTAKSRDELLITGGHLQRMDNVHGPIPNGPQLYPVLASVSGTTTGGSLAAGSYAVSGVFEYTDSRGRVVRSPPATPQTASVASGSSGRLVCSFVGYRIPDQFKQAAAYLNYGLKFVPYRTLVNESQVYYRAENVIPMNYLASESVTFTLSDSDASIADNEPLYTTGGVFEDYQPSAPIAIATNGRRFLVVSGDRPNFVREGKAVTEKTGVAFFEEIGREIAPDGPRIYALASYLDKWFAFKETAVFVASGDGADPTGQNDTLSQFEPITTGLGCSEPRSVITTSSGVVFKSARGFYLIGPDLSPRFIGAAVEDYTSTVKDSAYDKDNDIVYFLLEDNTTLVLTLFETEQGSEPRWTVDQNCGGNSVAVVNGVRYLAPASVTGDQPSIYRQSASYIDNQVSVTAVPDFGLTTRWQSTGEIQGFGRIWRANVLGKFPTAQASTTITIQIGYDYSSTWAETHTVSSTDFDMQGDNARFELRPARQKCGAIRFRITQGLPSSLANGAQGLSLNQIQLVVGIKPPDNRRGATHRARKQ
jgi:hypothetical protein